MTRVQSGNMLGNAMRQEAAAGDIMAQRAVVASLLVPPHSGAPLRPRAISEAETWARIAAANGCAAEDVMRLVHVLALKDPCLVEGTVYGTLEENRAEMLGLLAIIAEGADQRMSAIAINTIGTLLADPTSTPAVLDRAEAALSEGGHACPFFAAMLTATRARPPEPQTEETARRATCFESLAAALSVQHGVDRNAAHLMITSLPDYSPELLDSKEGWDTILAAVAANLGDDPAVTTTTTAH